MNVSVRTIYVASEETPSRFNDLDVVRLKRTVEDDEGRLIAAGTEGTIVSVYAEGAAFEVEFTRTVEALATVSVEDLELVDHR